MPRLIPYLIFFAIGFLVAAMLFRRRNSDDEPSSDFEKRYRELLSRYRDLTRKLGEDDDRQQPPSPEIRQASRYRQTLWDVRGMLQHPDGLPPDKAQSALEEIERALEE